jgi:hypothetical protein
MQYLTRIKATTFFIAKHGGIIESKRYKPAHALISNRHLIDGPMIPLLVHILQYFLPLYWRCLELTLNVELRVPQQNGS